MDPYVSEWLNLLLRWLHFTAGVAWIGASFYFNWLEGRLDRRGPKPDGVAGELWSVHGGGFYHSQKYEVAPVRLPETLHWFKWEAYTTWLSGFALLVLLYYLDPSTYLLGTNPLGLSPVTAVAIGLGSLIGGWLVYDGLCRSPLIERPVLFSAVGVVLVAALAWGLSRVFDGRGAYVQTGAIIGSVMVANVFYVIIPAQRRMVAAMGRGDVPDPGPGKAALRRSLHNNYLTLPVLFIMLSSHFPSTYGHDYGWAILVGLAVISAAVRHHFNLRNQGRRQVWLLPAAAMATLALIWLARPPAPTAGATAAAIGPVAFAEVRQIIDVRCRSCHAAETTHPAFPIAPLGYALDTAEQIRDTVDLIYARTVATRTMSLANMTGMTEDERARLGAWIEQGAKLD